MKENDQIIKIFNPSIIQCDEQLSNQNGIEAVLDRNLWKVGLQVASNFENSVEIHLKLLPTENQQSYKTLATSLKNAVTEEAFIRVNAQLKSLIKRQSDTSAKLLMDTLRFSEKV